MSITGGAVTNRDIRLSDVDATSTAVSSLDINGGFFTAQLMGIGTRHTVVDPVNGISTYGAGRGSVSIGSNAVVNLGQNMFLRPGSGNAVTINGSAASITAHRNGATGFEVHSDSAVNFNFDASGISTINLNGHANGSRLQFSWITNSEGVRPTGILNVDASNYPGSGTFYLFKFVNTIAGGVLGSGEFSQHNLTLASGSTGSVTYIRDQGVEGNGLVLTIVAAPSNAPELKVSRTDSGVEIRWETQSGFVLQSATSLDSPVNWENVSQTPVTEGNDSVVTLPANQAEAYFRLLK
jgi:hypothetical protein